MDDYLYRNVICSDGCANIVVKDGTVTQAFTGLNILLNLPPV